MHTCCFLPAAPYTLTRHTRPHAAGLVCLEMYKVLLSKPVEAFRNTFANLALPLFAMAEPMPPKTIKYKVRAHKALRSCSVPD